MTESMIERVARSVFEKIHPDGSFDSCDPSDLRKAIDVAAAAINAMRTPTREMVDSWRSLNDGGRFTGMPVSIVISEHVWPAMIEAALKWPAGSADKAGVPAAKD